jgi:hypothetical protein
VKGNSQTPRITIHAVHTDGELRRWTLSERVVSQNLDDDFYVGQLIERLSWATTDAEAIETETCHDDVDHTGEISPRTRPRMRSRGGGTSSHTRTQALAPDRQAS